MTLEIRVEERRPLTKTLVLEGRLDHESVDTSAGLRTIFRAHKAMSARAGKAVLLNPTPQVQKALDIVKVADLGSLFRSVQELDAYLDAMQKKVVGGE